MRLVLLGLLCSLELVASGKATWPAAKALFAESRFVEAQAMFSELETGSPQDSEIDFWQGRTALALGLLPEAVTRLEKAVAQKPSDAGYQHALGDAYGLCAERASLFSKTTFAKKCIAAFDHAVALEPGNVEYRKSRYEFYRAAPSFVGGGMDKAAAEIAEIEHLDPIQGSGLRADLLLKAGKVEEAFALLDKLHNEHPENKVVLFQLGRLSAMTGERLEAAEALLTAYFDYAPKNSDPPHWSAHWRLAQVLCRLGKPKQASEHYLECLRENPSFDRARAELKRLTAVNQEPASASR